MIWSIQTRLPQIALIPEYLLNGYKLTHKGLETRVLSYLMWNKKLKTLDYFSCDSVHDLGYLGPFLPNFPNVQVPQKQVKLNTQMILAEE